MDDVDKKKFIKIIISNMVEVLESGSLKDPLVQYKFIEDNLIQIACFDDKKINKAILKFFEDRSGLRVLIKDKQGEIQKPMDEYSENVKQIYELVKKSYE